MNAGIGRSFRPWSMNIAIAVAMMLGVILVSNTVEAQGPFRRARAALVDGVRSRVERVRQDVRQRVDRRVQQVQQGGTALRRVGQGAQQAAHQVQRTVELRVEVRTAIALARQRAHAGDFRAAMLALSEHPPQGAREQHAVSTMHQEIVQTAVAALQREVQAGSIVRAMEARARLPLAPAGGWDTAAREAITAAQGRVFELALNHAVESSRQGNLAATREALAAVDVFRNEGGLTLAQSERHARTESQVLHNLVRSGTSSVGGGTTLRGGLRIRGRLSAVGDGRALLGFATERYGRRRVAAATTTLAATKLTGIFGRTAGRVVSDVAEQTWGE